MENIETLWEYCTSNGRLVPFPIYWNELYQMLKGKIQYPSGSWKPALPLILAAWYDSIPIYKQMRFKEHIEWANEQGQLEQLSLYLRNLSEDKWCHFGEL